MDAPKALYIAGWGCLGLFLVGIALGQAVHGAAAWMLILIPANGGAWVIPWPLVLGIVLLNVGLIIRMDRRRRERRT